MTRQVFFFYEYKYGGCELRLICCYCFLLFLLCIYELLNCFELWLVRGCLENALLLLLFVFVVVLLVLLLYSVRFMDTVALYNSV